MYGQEICAVPIQIVDSNKFGLSCTVKISCILLQIATKETKCICRSKQNMQVETVNGAVAT